MNGNTSLANLAVVVAETCVNGCTAGTYLTVKFLCQLEQHIESFLRTHAITTGNYDRSTLEVVLCCLNMTVEHLNNACNCHVNILRNLWINHLFLALAVIKSLLHHTRTNGRHLWTMLRVNDGCNDVSTECRTNLIKKVLVGLACLLVLEVTNLKLGAVSGKSTGKR